jgi:hypothetical protein
MASMQNIKASIGENKLFPGTADSAQYLNKFF